MRNTRRLAAWAAGASFAVASLASMPSAWAVVSNILTYNAGNPTIFATQAIPASTTVVSFPDSAVFTVSGITTASGSATVTFSLPSGWTFSGTPSISCTGDITCTGPETILNNTATEGITFVAGASGTVSLNTPSVTNTALNTTVATAVKISVATNDPTDLAVNPAAVPFAESLSQLALTTTGANGAASLVIDIAAAAKMFIEAGISGADTTIADLGQVEVTYNGYLNAAGTAAFTFSGSTATLTLSGNFTGIGSSYVAALGASNSGQPCQASTPGGASGGVIGAGVITYTIGLPTQGVGDAAGTPAFGEVCLTASGTSFIASNATAPVAKLTAPAAVTSAAALLEPYNYNGLVQQFLYSGNFPSGYYSDVRIVNETTAAVPIFALVQPDTGGAPAFGQVVASPGIAANTNVVIPVSSIITAAGLPASTGQVSLTMLAGTGTTCVNNTTVGGGAVNSGPSCGVSMLQLMVSPNGTIVQFGSGTSP